MSGGEPASAAFGTICRLAPPDRVPPTDRRPRFRLFAHGVIYPLVPLVRFLGFVATISRPFCAAASGLMWHNAARINARKAFAAFNVPRTDPIIHPIDTKPPHHQHNSSRRLPDSRSIYPHPRRDLTLHILSAHLARHTGTFGGPALHTQKCSRRRALLGVPYIWGQPSSSIYQLSTARDITCSTRLHSPIARSGPGSRYTVYTEILAHLGPLQIARRDASYFWGVRSYLPEYTVIYDKASPPSPYAEITARTSELPIENTPTSVLTARLLYDSQYSCDGTNFDWNPRDARRPRRQLHPGPPDLAPGVPWPSFLVGRGKESWVERVGDPWSDERRFPETTGETFLSEACEGGSVWNEWKGTLVEIKGACALLVRSDGGRGLGSAFADLSCVLEWEGGGSACGWMDGRDRFGVMGRWLG
ncbi:hypothetical protein BDV93DRAFT_542995 [Ceratobasidium sp. AG-I]|nr:hypothetical protein BDV93DRAFT_542995 [Ceratobasidium sp. AG-I]